MEDKVIVVASGNQGKIKEFKEMLEPEGYTVQSLRHRQSLIVMALLRFQMILDLKSML